MPTHKERIEGGLIGLLVGDALGVPYEFHSPDQIPPLPKIEFTPPPGFHRAHAGVPPLEAGPKGPYDCGNGALMRVLPLALWHQGTDKEMVRDAQLQSCLTHGHLRSQVCCALYVLWARRMLEDASDPWQQAVETLRGLYAANTAATEELEWNIRPDAPAEGTGSGYVVDCLRSARWAVDQGDYEQVVQAAISLGKDTDTTACVAGGIAGLRDGVQGIPERWRSALRGRTLLQPLLDRLIARSSA